MPIVVRADAQDALDPVLGDPGRTYPNLIPDIQDVLVRDYRVIDEIRTERGLFLWFDTWAQNRGSVPLQLTVDEVETPESSTVSQCVSWRSGEAHLCREMEQVGGFAWHQAHEHFHYTDFARYELRALAPDGRPDYSSAGLLRISEKVSYCLVDSSQVQDDASPIPFYLTCLPTVQGISPGWSDIYGSILEGQNVDIAGLPNGRYAVIVDMNYANTLHETSRDDNYVVVKVEISDATGPEYPAGKKAVIVDREWPTPSEPVNTTTTTTTKKPKKPKN